MVSRIACSLASRCAHVNDFLSGHDILVKDRRLHSAAFTIPYVTRASPPSDSEVVPSAESGTNLNGSQKSVRSSR